MTFAAIQEISQQPSSLNSEYISRGTDEAEAEHWARLMNQPVEDDDMMINDLEEMGLR